MSRSAEAQCEFGKVPFLLCAMPPPKLRRDANAGGLTDFDDRSVATMEAYGAPRKRGSPDRRFKMRNSVSSSKKTEGKKPGSNTGGGRCKHALYLTARRKDDAWLKA